MSICRKMKQGYVIALSSIPPRFGRLGPVLDALLAQRPRPLTVCLCIAESYKRFPGPVEVPLVPEGVELIRGPDIGPGGKALGAVRRAGELNARLIYCDDDWIAGPNWAAALLNHDSALAVTGQGFTMSRLGRGGTDKPGHVDIAQGFSGVSVDPNWLKNARPPEGPASLVDDIWLSAYLAQAGTGIVESAKARAALRPAYEDGHGLQKADAGGLIRDQANRACAAWAHEVFGIWPNLRRVRTVPRV